jgi:hypothetical protein
MVGHGAQMMGLSFSPDGSACRQPLPNRVTSELLVTRERDTARPSSHRSLAYFASYDHRSTESSVYKIVVVVDFQKRHGSRARRRNKSWKR